ncbi:MAG: permease-like cell division protein FtsX [Gammaproteobacteria bacterium]|nr:permease-like cell division protein FtsX [Gammaproteobacteria bacterium]
MRQQRQNRRKSRAQQPSNRLHAYLSHHREVATFSLGKLLQAPVASFMTIAVIGIALALPGAFYHFLKNAQAVSQSWDDSAQISLYLSQDISDEQGQAIASALADRAEIISTRYISQSEALTEFKQHSGFGGVLDALSTNPLPGVIIAKPNLSRHQSTQLINLVNEFEHMPNIELAVFDTQWVARMYAILDVIQFAVMIVASLLCLAVLLAVGNTIRLDILARKEEIIVIKLIGASDAFVRRPFLYGGLWYGLFGGFFAILLISLALMLLEGPIETLATLYNSQFSLHTLSPSMLLVLLVSSSLLGLLGAWLAVSRHLAQIKPR